MGRDGPTRRQYVRAAATAGGGILAGCTSGTGSTPTGTSEEPTADEGTANDAFADRDWGSLWDQVDYEAMLEADPDVILHLWGITPDCSMSDTIVELEGHPAGSQLTAVKNGRVHVAGMRYQGPIMNLFQLEMGAEQLYPDLFGEWPGYEDGEHYPEIPGDEWLFDRNGVAAIVRGEFD